MEFRELLSKGKVIFDGAMGTYMASLNRIYNGNPEIANMNDPELVKQIHKSYISAGAQVITTNTFAINRFNFEERAVLDLLKCAVTNAFEAAGDKAAVFASIGQVVAPREKVKDEYVWLSERLLDLGVKNFIFETQKNFLGIKESAELIKSRCPDSFVIASFSVNDGGFTVEGLFANELESFAQSIDAIDAFGLNCGCSAVHMKKVVDDLPPLTKPLLLMPNAGYPTIVNRTTVYKGDPSIFAEILAQMAFSKADMVGGCCGTTPEHISSLCEAIKNANEHLSVAEEEPEDVKNEPEDAPCNKESAFWNKLVNGEKPIAVELDPPLDTDLTKFINGVKDLKNSKADIITIADCPIGRARMDAGILACMLERGYDMEALPHMTCRDRNLNAIQALMMGLYSQGIRNMLLVTGDPLPSAQRDEVKAVYQFNSRKLAAFASSLKEKIFPDDVHLFGALNVNARNFDIQLKLAKQKEENGIVGFLTQPVLTQEAFENLILAHEELDGYILAGIIPVVSERNARFMNSEINGINVDERIADMYAGKSRDESEELAVEISSEIARRVLPYCDGYYFMTPFQRTSLIKKIIDNI